MPSPTRFSALQVGVGALTGLVAGYAFFSQGSIEIHETGEIDFRGSDVILSISGADVLRVREATCTGTGGDPAANYDTCLMTNPLGTTGSLHRLQAEIAGSPVTTNTMECGFLNTADTGSGNVIHFSKQTIGTGTTIIWIGTGTIAGSVAEQAWNSADRIKCGLTVDPSSTFDAKIRAWYSDTYAD